MWAQRGIVYENDHRRAGKLIQEHPLGKKQVVVTPALRESRQARRKDAENRRGNGAGDGAHLEAGAGGTRCGSMGGSREQGWPRATDDERGAPMTARKPRGTNKVVVARRNFSAYDRPDAQCAAKQASLGSSPASRRAEDECLQGNDQTLVNNLESDRVVLSLG